MVSYQDSIVPKLGRPNFRRTAKEYFVLYRSRKPLIKRLTAKTIRYAVTQCRKGQKTSQIAKEIGVSQRHVQRLYARFCRTESHHVPMPAGRKPPFASSMISWFVALRCSCVMDFVTTAPAPASYAVFKLVAESPTMHDDSITGLRNFNPPMQISCFVLLLTFFIIKTLPIHVLFLT